MKTIDEAIAEYCEKLTPAYIAGCCGGRDPIYRGEIVSHEPDPSGKTYTRIVRVLRYKDPVTGLCREHESKSAVAFVKRDDGSIWKPAGWKGPAKNFSRGNVFELETVSWWL